MILMHNREYNPRIDFIVCKQLLHSLPQQFDELKLRKCFAEEKGETVYEKDLVALKKYFAINDVSRSTIKDAEILYFLTVKEKLSLQGEISEIEDLADIEKIARFVSKQNCVSTQLFKIMLLLGYSQTHTTPLMPFNSICEALYCAINEQNISKAADCWRCLLGRIQKYNTKHSLKLNTFCVEALKTHKAQFLSEFSAKKLGFYGSLALGKGSEYSDLDIIVILQNSAERSTKLAIRRFWQEIIPLFFDVTVVTEEEFGKLPVAINGTTKFI